MTTRNGYIRHIETWMDALIVSEVDCLLQREPEKALEFRRDQELLVQELMKLHYATCDIEQSLAAREFPFYPPDAM